MIALIVICSTAVCTLLITLVVANIVSEGRNVKYEICTDYGVKDPQFANVMGQLLGPPLLKGNQVTGLLNGVEIFPAMLAAINGAEKTICFETYIYWSGSIGREIANALCERATQGVKVHVLLDWLG